RLILSPQQRNLLTLNSPCRSGFARDCIRPDTGGMPGGLSYRGRAHAQGDSREDRRAARHRAQAVAGDLSEDGNESAGRPDPPAAQPARAPPVPDSPSPG
ncbi:60 kDa GroEL chaperonin, partial [Candidatus Burkholderia crenata]